jgi:Holliday junction resolvase
MTKKEKSNGTKPSAENDDDSRSTGRYEGAAKRGRANKRRGYYYEKRLEKLARSAGLTALRNPGSGAYPGFKGDVVLEGQLVEIKSRKSGFAFDEHLEPDRGNRYLVTFDSGRRGAAPIVRMRWDDFVELLRRNDEA